jgi:diphthine-ammonia ligase
MFYTGPKPCHADDYKIYGSFFAKPNPPARVTIACGEVLPPGYNIVVQLSISSRLGVTRSTDDLHVQSRSYWAPANIGPYSQARSDVIDQRTGTTGFVHVAGQIPLVPSTMALPEVLVRPSVEVDMMTDLAEPYSGLMSHRCSKFIGQAVLSLQHLWRIGQAMDLCYWTGVVAYLSKDTSSNISRKAKLAAKAWSKANSGRWGERDDGKDSDGSDADERDLWEERYHMAFIHREAAKTPVKKLPDWSVVKPDYLKVGRDNVVYPRQLPAFFAAEVEELPRGSDIEWHALLGVTRGPIKVA